MHSVNLKFSKKFFYWSYQPLVWHGSPGPQEGQHFRFWPDLFVIHWYPPTSGTRLGSSCSLEGLWLDGDQGFSVEIPRSETRGESWSFASDPQAMYDSSATSSFLIPGRGVVRFGSLICLNYPSSNYSFVLRTTDSTYLGTFCSKSRLIFLANFPPRFRFPGGFTNIPPLRSIRAVGSPNEFHEV
jgi:hypothetical protein